MATPDATILFTTKNRCEDLRRALRSAVAQKGAAVEILVLDDGSTDGTADMVRTAFPSVRLERRETSHGLIVRRNEGARLASGPVIFSLDDDAEFTSSSVVRQTLADFSDERIGAVAIPFINVLRDQTIHQRAPTESGCFVTDSYIGTAHAVRRDIFLALDGYREELVHQGEERDFCLRLLGKGRVVRLGNADPILHHESVRRDWYRMDYYGWRNNVLFIWKHVPTPQLGTALLRVGISCVSQAVRSGRSPLTTFQGLGRGFIECVTLRAERLPVNAEVYELGRRLQKSGPLTLEAIEASLEKPAFLAP